MQYKILSKYLATNTLLKKMKLKNTEMCSFCVDGREEMRHLFYECRFVSYFWVLFSNWWFLHTGTKIVFSYIDILFGYKITDTPILLHFCILTAKYYIYMCKIQLTIPKFESFLQHLRFEYEIEKCIAVQNGKAASFNNRWKTLQTWV